MVIDIRREQAAESGHTEPDELMFDEVVRVVAMFEREGARAEKHHAADHQQCGDGEEQKINALAMHSAVRVSSFSVVLSASDQAAFSLGHRSC
jgi:hypothetical protein